MYMYNVHVVGALVGCAYYSYRTEIFILQNRHTWHRHIILPSLKLVSPELSLRLQNHFSIHSFHSGQNLTLPHVIGQKYIGVAHHVSAIVNILIVASSLHAICIIEKTNKQWCYQLLCKKGGHYTVKIIMLMWRLKKKLRYWFERHQSAAIKTMTMSSCLFVLLSVSVISRVYRSDNPDFSLPCG